MTDTTTHTGRCLCGAIRFTVTGPTSAPTACHCSQCRRQSGHYWASTDVPRTALALEDATGALGWYQASAKVRRGFCTRCGGYLFWDPIGKDRIAIAMGAFDRPTGMRLERHIFVADQGDYYDIADGLPQNRQ